MGIEKGDRIVVSLPKTPHYFIIANAIFKMGAILVQSNPIYSERELQACCEEQRSEDYVRNRSNLQQLSHAHRGRVFPESRYRKDRRLPKISDKLALQSPR
uniref:AMP-dependent synthetase/ligase domain-containing protein n=1 Tax=Archaeoglobus fulgidus TaxID=2234 RepID=A0A7J3M1A0_ARCFL